MHEVVGAGQSRRRLDAPAVGGRVGEGDVGGDRVVEQQRVLEHDADGAAHVVRRRRSRTSTPSISTLPRCDVVEAQQQPGDGRLARPGRPDERDRLAGRELERRSRRAPAGGLGPCVAERHVAERDRADGARASGRRDRLRAGRRISGTVAEHLVDALRAAAARCPNASVIPIVAQRPDEQRDVLELNCDAAAPTVISPSSTR